MNAKAHQDEINRFLCSGDHDPIFREWSGNNGLHRIERRHEALLNALLSEVRRRQQDVTLVNSASSLPSDLTSFAREKLGPWFAGYFRVANGHWVTKRLEGDFQVVRDGLLRLKSQVHGPELQSVQSQQLSKTLVEQLRNMLTWTD